ncbi:energy transducer TonB family protein [Dyella choica]|uniref:Energy transducer TonB n=1 Tax=Dyella choica TaxID=1927959 RepID=A0A432M7G1_9GAMM|nr:energy transducer TonB [Dyella choica]RUL76115.1 energy transducer TonB [Dyella choica]
MPRLRITATLSLLALVIGAAATQWLSDQTAGRATPPETGPRIANIHLLRRGHLHAKATMALVRPRYVPARGELAATPAAPVGYSATLQPIATPMSSLPTARMEDHAVGNVVLHLTVDGQGQVTAATVAQSSGDAILDTNAMDLARHWRFAVPADHPQGLSGDLPMRFTGELAQAQ